MRIFYREQDVNFGDALNGWLWERLLPGAWDPDDGISFAGIGTIIRATMPEAKRWVVFTSGAGYGGVPRGIGTDRWTIVSVRGPLTARALGLSPGLAVTDGAILLATLPEYSPLPDAERQGIVFVPHHAADDRADWAGICATAGMTYVSPVKDGREVIAKLRRAKLVIADAMHAAIIADTLRVPWVPVVTASHINTFKWLDWARSMDVPYEPRHLPSGSAALAVQSAMGRLSGQNYHFDGSTDALTHFTALDKGRNGWRGRGQKLARRVQRRAGLALKNPGVAGALAGTDRRLGLKTAAALAAAARQPGYLSSDAVHAQRLEALTSALETVRKVSGA